jgi:hypothetical protein
MARKVPLDPPPPSLPLPLPLPARVLPPISHSHRGEPPDRDGGGGGRHDHDAVANAAQPRGGGGRRRPPAADPPRRGVTAPRRRPGPSVPASPDTFSGISSRKAPTLGRSPHVSAPGFSFRLSVSSSSCLTRSPRRRQHSRCVDILIPLPG